MTTQNSKRVLDGFNKNTGQQTEVIAARVFADQKAKLNTEYEGNASALIRLLLEEYFAGRLPMAKIKFQQFLNTTK